MARFRASILFIYGLAVTLLAFIYRDILSLSIISIPNILIGTVLGWRRFKFIILLLFLGFIGLFLNAYLVSNTGELVIKIWLLDVREGLISAITTIGFRLMAIAGGTLIFLSLVEPYETVKSLENDLFLPKGISFSIYYALRLLPLIQREAIEIQNIRVQRGFRKYLITPSDFKSFILPLLSIFLERAYWTGIAAELRGFQLRRPSRKKVKLSFYDYLIIASILLQILLPYIIKTFIIL